MVDYQLSLLLQEALDFSPSTIDVIFVFCNL